MKNTICLIIIFLGLALVQDNVHGKARNVILMIPDGTSPAVITMARWYATCMLHPAEDCPDQPEPFAFDTLFAAMVRTNSADGRIADSAPSATAYATGCKSHSGFVGVSADTVPRMTILEAARIVGGKSTGLVFTCQANHATPAAFSSHTESRGNAAAISKQQLYNSIDVVFGGGWSSNYNRQEFEILRGLGYQTIRTTEELEKLVPGDGERIKAWGLFNADTADEGYLAFDADRKRSSINEPSLSRMAGKAIDILNRNPNGFFLMIEGSKVDWAAHNNNALFTITEFLAFEEAVDTVLNKAKDIGNTLVIICADHGNGGFSIGNKCSGGNSVIIKYDRLSYCEIVKRLIAHTGDNDDSSFIGWTTTGHTGEDVPVFWYSYPPADCRPLRAVNDNTDIGRYIAEEMDLGSLDSLSNQYYVKASELAKEYGCSLEENEKGFVVRKDDKYIMLFPDTNLYEDNCSVLQLPTVNVLLNGKDFYISRRAMEMFR